MWPKLQPEAPTLAFEAQLFLISRRRGPEFPACSSPLWTAVSCSIQKAVQRCKTISSTLLLVLSTCSFREMAVSVAKVLLINEIYQNITKTNRLLLNDLKRSHGDLVILLCQLTDACIMSRKGHNAEIMLVPRKYLVPLSIRPNRDEKE